MKIPDGFERGIDLPRSIERYQKEPTPQAKLQLFRELKSAKYLVPYRGDRQNVAAIRTAQGEVFLPAFTCEQELMRGGEEFETIMALPFDVLKHIVIDQPKSIAGIALDPFGKTLQLRHPQLREIDSALEGMTLQRNEYQKAPMLSQPRNLPVGLPRALSALFQRHPEVYRAWILLARRDEKEPPHKLFLIDFDGDRKNLFPIIARQIEPFMCPGESFELMKADIGLLHLAQGIAAPFYSK